MADSAQRLPDIRSGPEAGVLDRAAGYLTRSRLFVLALLLVPVTVLLEVAGIWSDTAKLWRFPLGHDFVAFWAAAKLFMEGGAARLYDLAAYAALQDRIAVRSGFLLWHYPPHYLALILPLAGLSFGLGYLAFTAVNFAALGAVGWRIVPFRTPVGWAALFGAPVMAATIVQGQNGAVFAACLIGGMVARERGRPWLSAALIALLLAKPQYGALIPIVLLARRDWPAIRRIAICCAVFTGLVTLLLGPEIWVYFWQNIHMLGYSLTEAELLAQMPTAWAALRLAGVPAAAASILHIGVALAAIRIVWSLWSRPGTDPDLALAALLLGTLMISPYGFRYDMVLTLGGTLLLMRYANRHGLHPAGKIVLAAMWLLPAVFPPVALLTGAQIGPLIPLAGLGLCLDWARRRGREAEAPDAQPAAAARAP